MPLLLRCAVLFALSGLSSACASEPKAAPEVDAGSQVNVVPPPVGTTGGDSGGSDPGGASGSIGGTACGAPGTACINDLPVPCARADETYCDECGCGGGMQCVPGVGCRARAELGQACSSDDDCKSANCGKYARICRVPVGQPCDLTNCDLCATSGSTTYCTRDCEFEECGANLACVGKRTNGYRCEPRCASETDECPGTCRQLADFVSYSCECDGPCQIEAASRPLGALCSWDAMCDDGLCLNEDVVSFQRDGLCSKSCTENADCGDGAICGKIPCTRGDTTECGNTCLRTCSSTPELGAWTCPNGHCASRSGTDAKSYQVCDPKLVDGADCSNDWECRSANCASNRCAPRSAANGAKCGDASDCSSGNCLSGTCVGSAQLGDACKTTPDCAVGACCSLVCSTGC